MDICFEAWLCSVRCDVEATQDWIRRELELGPWELDLSRPLVLREAIVVCCDAEITFTFRLSLDVAPAILVTEGACATCGTAITLSAREPAWISR